MISQLLPSRDLRLVVLEFLPMSLWLLLIFSLQAGNLKEIGNPNFSFTFLHGVRAAFPFTAALLSLAIIIFRWRNQAPNKVLFAGPLGLTAVYGLMGVIASILSPDASTAFFWSVSYLSVPLVLWAVVGESDYLELVRRVVNFNLLILVIASVGLFTFALINLNLADFLLDPSRWTECKAQGWFFESSEYIRGTGVGRYGALTALIALSRFWHPGWRPLWVIIFLISIILLVSSASRTPLVGFGVAAPIVFLLSGGKNAAFRAIIIIALLAPIVWATGVHQQFTDCLFRTAGISYSIEIPPTPPSSVDLGQQQSTGLLNSGSTPDVPTTTSTPDVPTTTQSEPVGFFSLTGRREVWRQGLIVFKDSPLLGRGFHADRIILKTHTHNTVVHSLIQTGVAGSIPLFAAVFLGWIFLFKSLRRLDQIATEHKVLVIQTAGVFTFLAIRSITESTGAFFGVDWLILAPFILYIGLVQGTQNKEERP